MVNKVLSYVNSAIGLVPYFGKSDAVIFVLTLFLESGYRTMHYKGSTLGFIYILKNVNILNVSWATSFGRTFQVGLPLALGIPVLTSPCFLKLIRQKLGSPLLDVGRLGNEKKIQAVIIQSDPPAADVMIASVAEMLNVVSKTLGSLATGAVVQKLVTGQKEGVIQYVVSSVLLALSLWNFKNVIEKQA